MIKSKTLLSVFYTSLLFFPLSCTTDYGSGTEPTQTKSAKVIGYLSSDNFSKIGSIQFCKLTHLNLAFANPNADGSIHFQGSIDAVIQYVKSVNPNIKISISLAGGAITQEQATNWSLYIDNSSNRPILIRNIVAFVNRYHLDGVDVDLEWDAVTSGYSGFILELKTALAKNDKLLTAALPNNFRFQNISDPALNAFDFINIMSYDSTGPWTPNQPGQHSSILNAQNGVDFWHQQQHIPTSKLTLGVPFYGYNFVDSPVSSSTFGQIVESGVQHADLDQVGQLYYNGRPTISKKVEYASQNTGGIMIWEISQDSFSTYSLLDVIHKKYSSLGYTTTGLCGN
ncbi:glycosyl hydrolase family 18 protein [Chryseobacterium tongliaoense]|uniref:glycosyl hydrolase family 18 protein n=1 Tax=Chryseobacterium tongliaoense TaxID=3240933 RepID=UPI0035193FE4